MLVNLTNFCLKKITLNSKFCFMCFIVYNLWFFFDILFLALLFSVIVFKMYLTNHILIYSTYIYNIRQT